MAAVSHITIGCASLGLEHGSLHYCGVFEVRYIEYTELWKLNDNRIK